MAFLTGFVLTARSDPLLPEVHAAPIALCVLTCAVAPVTTSQQGKNVWALWRHVRTVVRTFAKIGQLQLKLSSINIFHCIKLLYFSLSLCCVPENLGYVQTDVRTLAKMCQLQLKSSSINIFHCIC